MKATAGIVNGKTIEIFKDPKTDDGMKKSAKGFLSIRKNERGDFYLRDQVKQDSHTELVEVFRDGKLIVDQKFSDIRARIDGSVTAAIKS